MCMRMIRSLPFRRRKHIASVGNDWLVYALLLSYSLEILG